MRWIKIVLTIALTSCDPKRIGNRRVDRLLLANIERRRVPCFNYPSTSVCYIHYLPVDDSGIGLHPVSFYDYTVYL